MLTLERPSPTAAADPPFVERIRGAIELLELAAADWRLLDALPAADRRRLHRAVAGLSVPDRRAGRKRSKAARAEKVRLEEGLLETTGIRALRRRPIVTTPNVFPPPRNDEPRTTNDEPRTPNHERRTTNDDGPLVDRVCYICKQPYSDIHTFYDHLCPACADVNFAARTELADLRGRVALLTGGRVKIGYQAGLKLLRSGAHLIVTTRFPRNAAARYALEPDFADWSRRLEIFGLDLRHTPSVEAFCRELVATRTRLDFIINNACQTVRRPPEFYAHLMAEETSALRVLPEDAQRLLGREGQDGLEGGIGRMGGTGRIDRSSSRRSCRKCRCSSKNCRRAPISSPPASSMGIFSRSICATGIPGGCCSPTFRPSRCSRCSW